MRFVYSVLLQLILFSCAHIEQDTKIKIPDPIKLSVKARLISSFDSTYIDYQNFSRKTFKIDITLKNESNRRVTFWIMYCSWQENFLINYPSVEYLIECPKNFPTKTSLDVNDSIVFKAFLWPNEKLLNGFQGIGPNPVINSTKFGFLYIDTIKCKDYHDFKSFIHDRSKQENVFWSNPLFLFNN
jgi:hypothetical protein